MKKVKFLLVSLISIFAFNINVFATSGSLGVSSSSVYVGDSFTVTANVSSAAAWNIHVSASGPVSGCSINQADATADAMDTNKTFSATCTATGTGTITITLSGDVTSASNGNAVNVSGSRSVSVSNRPTPPSNNNNNNNNNIPRNNNNNHSNNNNSNNNQATDNRSKNNNIKELSVEGYDLTKVDNNNYTLSVPNDVTSINIKATAEDSKSKVTGAGSHDINVGENNIEVVVTAENGSQNKITIKVTRKDGYYLEDLDTVLKNNKIADINITIKFDTKITAQDLEKIKSSGKTVKFNYYNDDKSLVYSWIVDGSKLKNTSDLFTTILNDSDNKKDILRLSNYADGLFVGLKQTSNLPSGTKIKLFIGNKYKDNDLVNVYAYVKNNDKLELVKSKLKVENGYVEFDVTYDSDYFVTMSTIPSSDKVVTTTGNSSSPILLIIIGILSLLVIGLVIAFIVKNKKNKKDDNNNNNSSNSTLNNDYETLTIDTNKVDTISSSQSANKTYNDYNINQSNNTASNINYNNYSNYNNQSSNDNSNEIENLNNSNIDSSSNDGNNLYQ